MSFLTDVLSSANELEPPLNFWYWSGLAAISAVVKDNVWMPRAGSYYNLYPNIYVMLHAESGLKKGPPINLAKDLVKRVNNTRIISGRSSIQGILKELGTAYTMPGGKVMTKSVAFIVSSELTSSIVEDKAAATILTDLYDRNYNEGQWKSLLKMESFEFKNSNVTMLTDTNEAHSDDFFTKRDIKDRFFARTFIVFEKEENTINSLVLPLRNPFDRAKLVEYLKKLMTLAGPFEPLGSLEKTEICHIEVQLGNDLVGYMSPVGKLYDDWYIEFKKQIKESGVKDKTGTINRFGDSVIKVAMLLALSERPELRISEQNMLEAISHCEKLVGAARQTTQARDGKSTYAFQKNLIIHELVERPNHMITRTQLLKKYMFHFDPNEWDQVILPSLMESGNVQVEINGKVILYVMPETVAEDYKHLWEGKNK